MHNNTQDKQKLIISATNFARLKLNVDENLWVFINDKKHFLSINHSALYDKQHFLIRYNSQWLKIANNSDIIKCAFHEVFHAFQHQELIKKSLGISSSIFTSEELEQMEFEFKDENYMLNNWENMLVEKQAEYFSDYLYSHLIKNNFNELNFINKYFDLYPNIENVEE